MSPVSPREPPGWTLVLPQAPPAPYFIRRLFVTLNWGAGPCSLKNYRLRSVTVKARPALWFHFTDGGAEAPEVKQLVPGHSAERHGAQSTTSVSWRSHPARGTPLFQRSETCTPWGDQGDVLACKASRHRLRDTWPRAPGCSAQAGRRLVAWAGLGRKTHCCRDTAPGHGLTGGFPERDPPAQRASSGM